MRISLALLASTILLGAGLFFAAWSPSLMGFPVFGITGFMLLGIGLGLFGALGVQALFGKALSPNAWKERLFHVIRFFSWRRDDVD